MNKKLSICQRPQQPHAASAAHSVAVAIVFCSAAQACCTAGIDARSTAGRGSHVAPPEVMRRIAVGLGLCLFGHYLRFMTMFTVGFVSGFGGLVIILSDFVLEHDSESNVVFVLTLISVAFGILMAYLTTTVRRIGIFFLGMWVGVIMALFLNNTFLYKTNKGGTVWIAMSVIGTFFGVLGLWLKNRITIICTSFIGAYFTIRPLGWYIGHWPNEFTIVRAV